MRGHASAVKLLEWLASVLAHPLEEIAAAAAVSVSDILRDSDILSKAGHSNMRALYKQRVIMQLLPVVLASYQDGKWQGQCAAAVAHVLRNAPKGALRDQVSSLLPLLGAAMTQENAEAAAAGAETLRELVEDHSKAIGQHLSELIPALLHLALKGTISVCLVTLLRTIINSLQTARISALNCLSEFTKLPFHLLFPHRNSVIAQLAQALDDRKRPVRRAAVVCRGKWYMLSSAPK